MLLGLLRAEDGMQADAIGMPPKAWDDILELALQHNVASLLDRALQAGASPIPCPDHVRAQIDQARRATALDNLRNYGQLRRVARALRAAGIPVMALKGMHLAELVYRDISLRPMRDLDLLVPRSQLEAAVAVLHGLDYGYAEELAGEAGAMRDIKCNIGFAHRDIDVWLELHWSLDEPPARYTAVLKEVWRSAVPTRLGDTEALVMVPEFLLLHVCAHLACNHNFAFSLHALCDIAEILRVHPALDWAVVVDHARRHCWHRGVAAALRLAHDQLAAAVPADVLAALGADVLDPAMLAEAMQHLLACVALPGELRTAPNFMAFAGKQGGVKKLATLWARIFVPRAELALKYGVSEHSVRLPLYYGVRMKDLLRKYSASAWAMNVTDPQLAAAAARHTRLANWISSD
jgi:hypothetical protein